MQKKEPSTKQLSKALTTVNQIERRLPHPGAAILGLLCSNIFIICIMFSRPTLRYRPQEDISHINLPRLPEQQSQPNKCIFFLSSVLAARKVLDSGLQMFFFKSVN
jgi:hypothetical protein